LEFNGISFREKAERGTLNSLFQKIFVPKRAFLFQSVSAIRGQLARIWREKFLAIGNANRQSQSRPKTLFQ
jgi:hypothetical protein